jgi:hypothetical protein
MSELTITPQIINDMADHIERVGLNKGSYFKDVPIRNVWYDTSVAANVPCCTLGALHYVVASDSAKVAYSMEDELAQLLDVDFIPTWNDKPSQRKSRVVARLRKAAAALEAAA